MTSVVLALAPKCPFCVIGYLGLAAGGLISSASSTVYPVAVVSAMVSSLMLAVGALAWRAHERGGYGPAALALGAALVLLVAKFGFEHPPSVVVSLVALLAAAGWSSWLSRAKPSPSNLTTSEVDRCHHSS